MYALQLESGNVIASGHYWNSLSEDRGAVLQLLTTNGTLLEQWTSASPYPRDLPAIARAIDIGPEGHLYFAQMNNDVGVGVMGNAPSQIDVFRLDTNLQVLSSFRFDGFASNKYFFPATVTVSHDGSVFLTGSTVDLNVPGSQPQGWVAKIGADSFVSVMERPKPTVSLFPNPGKEGFQLVLGEPLTNGRLEIHDVQGKLVHTEPFTGVNGQVTVPGLTPGVYCVSFRNANGTSMLHQRWVKQ